MARKGTPKQKLSLVGVWAEVLTTYRDHLWPLLATAAIVFGPVALIEAATEPIREVDTSDGLAIGEGLSAGLLVASLALVGEVFYTGVVAALVGAHRGGDERTLGEVARELPYLRLVAVDVLFMAVVLGGILLLVIPGIVAVAWFVLAGPVVEIEGLGVRAAFGRSRELARGNAMRILALMIPLLLLGDALAEAAAATGNWVLGDGLIGHFVSSALSEIATAPLFGLAAVVTAHHLIGFRPRDPSPPSPRPAP